MLLALSELGSRKREAGWRAAEEGFGRWTMHMHAMQGSGGDTSHNKSDCATRTTDRPPSSGTLGLPAGARRPPWPDPFISVGDPAMGGRG